MSSMSMSEDELATRLLNCPPADHVIFKHSDAEYKENMLYFAKDIVSLWNTPDREDAYIVLGALPSNTPPRTPVGLQRSTSDGFYQTHFPSYLFQMKPKFKYKEVLYNNRRIGIVTIESSRGCGAPCVVVSNEMAPEFQKGQVWARKEGRNSPIAASDFFVVRIHIWCSRSADGAGYRQAGACDDLSAVLEGGVLSEESRLCLAADPYSETAGAKVLKALGNFGSRGHFVLLCGTMEIRGCENIEALAYPPWIAVYDFDFKGRDSGLLNILEDKIEQRRHLSVATWMDSPRGITENGTQWWSLQGRRDVPESRTPDTSHSDWFYLVHDQLERMCFELERFTVDYTALTFLVLWPSSVLEARCMYRFLRKVGEHVRLKIVLCFANQESQNYLLTEAARMIRWEFDEDSLQVFNVTLNDLCSEIERLERRKGPAEKFQYQLPSHEQKPVTISEADAADLKVDLDVLYLKSPYTKQDKSDLKTLADNFFRGGTIDWCAFYSMGLHEVDVKRDIQKELEDYIRDRIESCSPGMLTLYHNPGSGGSTLARRVLWTLHEFAPCVQVKQRTGSSTEEVANKLRFLCDQTQQAIVALMDADDEPKIKQLSQYLQRSFVIILQVKRYPYPIHTPGHCSSLEGTFYLPGVVSKQESIKLVHKLKQKCNGDSTKEQVLETLNAEVEEGNRHQMFEYGMAVYAHEFQGVKTYVRGYLQLDENPDVDLQSWQRCLGYLALVYYYVQIPLPLQFFAGIKLAKPDDRVLTLDNFPEQFKVFVVRDLNEGRNHVFRICYYLIAKEILEQILNRSYIRTQGISDKLSAVAKRQLKSFCLDFISLAAKRNVTTSLAAQTATFTMAKTFIFRDFLEVRDLDAMERPTKKKFSQIMLDLDPEAPYEGRLEVMHKLCSTFPQDPSFRAHLGRCYSICQPAQESEAEKHFNEALKLCQRESRRSGLHELNDRSKLTLLHVYHMYGMVFQRRLAAITGWDQDSRVQCLASGDQFHKKLEDVLLNADRACQNFSLARHYTPPDEEDNYTYMNEIHARLQACGFVNRFYPGGNQAFLSHKTDDATVKSMQAFIQKSLTEIEDLIMECYYVVLVHDGSPLEKYVVWFNSAFKDCAMKLRSMASGSDIESLRLQVAAKKLQLRQDSSVVAVGADMPPEEIESLVGDLEKIFRLVQHHGRGDDLARRKLELDFKDWILAVRHPCLKKVYMLYAVLEKVRQWHDNAESLNSTFYLFVINSLIGFGTDSHHANPECLDAARYLLQERMQKLSKRNARLKWPKEWLGREDAQGIRRLVSSNSVATDAKERKVHSGPSGEKLAVCKGTICSPNTRPLAGHIDLDLGEDVTLKDPVKVFFVPKLAKQYNGSNLEGTKYAGKRVQFHLAFTLANGYEAYTIKLLKKYKCSKCPRMMEMTSHQGRTVCSSCKVPTTTRKGAPSASQ